MYGTKHPLMIICLYTYMQNVDGDNSEFPGTVELLVENTYCVTQSVYKTQHL